MQHRIISIFSILIVFTLSVRAQLGLLQPRLDHFSEFSFLDLGGPSCIGESSYLFFAQSAPKNQNAVLTQIDYDLGYPGSIYFDHNSNTNEYTLCYREWMSGSFNVDSVAYGYSTNPSARDTATYTFSKGGPPSNVASQIKWEYDSNLRVSRITESSLYAVTFYNRVKYYFYSGNQLDSTSIVMNNDSALIFNQTFFWSNTLLDSVKESNSGNAEFYTYDVSSRIVTDSLYLGLRVYVSHFFYDTNGRLDSSMFDTYQLWDTTKLSCYNQITYDSLGNYDKFSMTFYNHATQASTFGYYKFFYSMNSIGTIENEPNEKRESDIIFPNPVTNMLYIEAQVPFDFIELLDVGGKVFLRKADGERSIDVSYIPSGIYVLKVHHQDKMIIHRIVKL